MTDEFVRLHDARAEVFEDVHAHVRKLRSQPQDESWNAEYARLLGVYAEADR